MTRTLLLALTASTAVAGTTYLYGQGTPVQLQPTTPGTQQVGNANISGRLIAGAVVATDDAPTGQAIVGNATSTSGANFGGFFRSDSVLGRALYGRATALSGTTHGVWGQSDSPAGRGVTGVAPATSGNATGVWGQTASTTGRGVYGYSTSSSGINYGVMGQSSSPAGYGVYSVGNMHATGMISGNGSGLSNVNASLLGGKPASSFLESIPLPLILSGDALNVVIQGSTHSASSSGSGIKGFATNSVSQAQGVLGLAVGHEGVGVSGMNIATSGINYGVWGQSGSPSGIGTFGLNAHPSGATVGVKGESRSSNGYAVFGFAPASSGGSNGVRGQSTSPDGRGVLGWASATTGLNYGVRGQSESASGFGVYSVGRTGASGTKSFRIDHPFDPENKYLLHYATESPTPQNFYVGNVVTDAQGNAWVTLPDYFSEINKNFKYQLTVVGKSFAQAVVWEKLQNNRFQIRTNAPNIEVSWRVDADRNDLYIRHRPATDTEVKSEFERGKFQHPEFYGFGPERGMEIRQDRDKPREPSPRR